MIEVPITETYEISEEFVAYIIKQAILKSKWITKCYSVSGPYKSILDILNGENVHLQIEHLDRPNKHGHTITNINRERLIEGMSEFFSNNAHIREKLDCGYEPTDEEVVEYGERIILCAYFDQ